MLLTLLTDRILFRVGQPEEPHVGSLHGGRDGQNVGVEGLAEHLLGPVQEGGHVGQDGLPAAELLVKLDAVPHAQERGVVHRALHTHTHTSRVQYCVT